MADNKVRNADYYSDFIDAPVERELVIGDKRKLVYFRSVTAGERRQLNQGQVYKTAGTEHARETTHEMDLGDIDKRRLMLVQFMNCLEDGKTPVFMSLDKVAALPNSVFDPLYRLAEEVDAEFKKADEGKSSSKTPS